MKVALHQYSGSGWNHHPVNDTVDPSKVQLALCFSSKSILQEQQFLLSIREKFPAASIACCSTAGEIIHETVCDNTAVLAAMEFEDTRIGTAAVNIADFASSYEAAVALIQQLPKDELCYVLVLSDGSLVNGSELVKGFRSAAKDLLITGGLAGDAADFKSTLTGLNGKAEPGKIIAIGFYGKKLVVTHGSQGGWDMFGLEKEITRSSGNVLFEIENENALDTYKKYLGSDAENLPGAALFFPIAVTIPGAATPVVRTILSIDEDKRTMTFAGDVPEGSQLRFMRANFDTLTMAAATAAQYSLKKSPSPDFALLISCVGRKLVLGPRIDEEVEAVCHTLGNSVPVAGFYSYGEISPFNDGGGCQLHNQTMTITSFYELP
jgi:hypothetical protein